MSIILQEQRRGLCPKIIELPEEQARPMWGPGYGATAECMVRVPTIAVAASTRNTEAALSRGKKRTPAPSQGVTERLDAWQAAVRAAAIEAKRDPKTAAQDPGTLLSRQLGMMIRSGIRLEQGLVFIQLQTMDETFREIIATVQADVASGSRLSEALEEHPRIFTRELISLVRAGEANDSLGENLERFTEQRDGEQRMATVLGRLWRYPLVVFGIANLVVAALLVFVIPQFKEIFMGMRIELPLMTQALFVASDFLTGYGLILVPFLIGFPFMAARLFERTIGGFMRRVALAGFTRMLGTMLLSGVPAMQAVETAARIHGAPNVPGFFPSARDLDGQAMARLGAKLSELAVLYESDVENSVRKSLWVIEPLVIVFMGMVVGGIVLTVFTPMLGLCNCACG